MENRRFRLRPCHGNVDAWIVVLIRHDGEESELYSACAAGLSAGGAIDKATRCKLLRHGDMIEYA